MGNNKHYNHKKDHSKKDKAQKKENKERQIRLFVKNMSNYSLPITNEKETPGKSILGAYANVAQDNLSKTLQYIYLKIGYKASNSKYIEELKEIERSNRKEKEWKENHPGDKKPGQKSKRLLSDEQGEKMKTLLFHHFSVIAPVLGSMKNQEIDEIKEELENGEEQQSLSEEKVNDIIKKVKCAVKSAGFLDCLKVLVCLSESLDKCRNYYSHYRAYNNHDNQIKMLDNFAVTAGYLSDALKASAKICESNAGKNTAQYEFLTGGYHYDKNKEEFGNYYYRIRGKRNIIKASGKYELDDKKEPIEHDAISDFGLVYLISLFLRKSDMEDMLDQLEVLKESPFKDIFKQEKAVLTSSMAVYRINLPKGKRLKMEDDNVQFSLDMLNELQKCPQELYDVIVQEGKDSFKREQTEPMRNPETGEYIREKFVKNEKGEIGQHKETSTDGTGNIVYQGKGVYSLLVRKEDRFPYFALRYIDNCNIFPTIRFQIDLGYYRFAFYPKIRIDGSEETRILQKRINGFGKLVETDNCREVKWKDMFQESEMRNPNETENAEIARDEEGNIIELDQKVKADINSKPFVTDKRASYNIHSNRIGLYWKEGKQSQNSEEAAAPYIPDLKNKEDKDRPDVKIVTPMASLSVYDLPALIFYEYLREGIGKTAEEIIKEKYKHYKEFFKGVADGIITSWDNIKQLKKNDIPEKFWPYFDGKVAGNQNERIIANFVGKEVKDGTNSYHFKGHIQERIDYLEKEIKKFNDICLKMVITDNEYGTDDYKAFRPASLAQKMARSIMEWMPNNSSAKKTMTGVNYGVMTSVMSKFGSDGREAIFLKNMFVNGGIIAPVEGSANNSDFHPFLSDILNIPVTNMETLYIEYISRELAYVKQLRSELEVSEDKRAFIMTRFPFAKLSRKRFDDRDRNYYRSLAKRYLTIDNSENGDDKKSPAIILLPDGLFTNHIFSLLKEKYPLIFTGNSDEGTNNNASFLISTFFEKVTKDESQNFYQCFTNSQKKNDSRYRRHYKFFDLYDNPKLQKENYPENANGKGKSASLFESAYFPKEIGNKLKAIHKDSIIDKVEEYILLEDAKMKSYQQRKAEKEQKLEVTKNGPKKWTVYSKQKNREFTFYKDKVLETTEEQLKKLDQMILNSEQKMERIKDSYVEKLTSLKNECQRTEKTIRRYRIEDIVTFYMVSAYFKELFKNKPEDAKFQLRDIGSKKFVEGTENNDAFLDKTVPFSRSISVTFARDEKDMFKKGWENDEKIEKITIDCEIFLNRIAIRNYNLALADLNDERLYSFLAHYAYIRYLYGAKLDKPLRINYNRLMLEFKVYNQMRSDIFSEVHAIEKRIVDNNTNILNNDKNTLFYTPMKDEDKVKIKKGQTVVRKDEDAKRNSFVNLLALVFDEKNDLSRETNNIRNSVAHNYYGLPFKGLADNKLLLKIMNAYEMPDKLPHELKSFDKEVDLAENDPHSFAALILRRIREIRKVAEEYIMRQYGKTK